MTTEVTIPEIQTQGKKQIEYIYKNAAGEVEGRVLRIEENGRKDFLPQRLQDGAFTTGLKGAKLPIYGIDSLPADPKKLIFWVEGEKCADFVRTQGGVALTTAGGAQGFHSWLEQRKADLSILIGRTVVVLSDCDEPGIKYAAEVCDALVETGGIRVQVIPAQPWTTPGSDIIDWFEADKTATLARLVETRKNYVPRCAVQHLDEMPIENKPIEWLWKDRIPLGFLTMVFGDGGCGKSFMLTDLMARITRGDTFPDGSTAPFGSVMLLDKEQHSSDIKSKFAAAGADMSKVIYLHTVPSGYEPSLEKIEEIEQVVRSIKDLKMIVIDPITDFTGSTDINNETAVRKILSPLKEIAEIYNVAVVFIRHNNKAAVSAKNKVGGSTAWTNVVRFSWMVSQEGNISTMSIAKTNFGKPLAFNFTFAEDEDGQICIKWLDQINLTADQILESALSENKLEIKEACEWLKAMLRSGDQTSENIFSKGGKNGYSKSALRQAMNQLNVRTYLIGEVEWRQLKPTFGSSTGWEI